MNRPEFIAAFADRARWKRGLLPSTAEAAAHVAARQQAATIWREKKNRLQNLSREQWLKKEQEGE